MKILLKLALTGGLLWLVAANVDWTTSSNHLMSVPVGALSAAVLALFVQLVITSFRFVIVLRLFDIACGFWESLRCNLIGSFFTQTFLSFVGGDVARVWFVTRLEVSVRTAAGIVLLDRVWGLIVNILLVLVGVGPLFHTATEPVLRWVLVILWAVGLAGVVGFVVLGLLHDTVRAGAALIAWPRLRKAAELAADLATISRYSMKSWRLSAALFATSVVIHLLTVLIVQILVNALGGGIGFAECLIVVPTIILITMIPVSIGGWGVRENAMVIGFGLFSVAGDKALAASVLFGLLSLLFGLAGGFAWLADTRRRRMRDYALPANSAAPAGYDSKILPRR